MYYSNRVVVTKGVGPRREFPAGSWAGRQTSDKFTRQFRLPFPAARRPWIYVCECTFPRLEFSLGFRSGRARSGRGRYLGGDASSYPRFDPSNPQVIRFDSCHREFRTQDRRKYRGHPSPLDFGLGSGQESITLSGTRM